MTFLAVSAPKLFPLVNFLTMRRRVLSGSQAIRDIYHTTLQLYQLLFTLLNLQNQFKIIGGRSIRSS
jgi:hypothetical protein